ncbi:MAG TPA: hypothetical protein DEQ87_06075 [Algoriphagus sp.]|jgi:drug/metabolite transporter (DMT)-like permease|uniref:hypothetical protein n=1 Tax=unclassified Algoriphagus TaxID=2641541 RepID=UPI000C434336|nr:MULTISPECIES: hypothetical protein [unclassified Algoriphagus]MAL13495.1 hypothetical protein [Algoriphagus sp.]QYH38881.1 hypothetical protein GYM62_08770 [Algoriphagus sp. NBT04N3]HAH35525.1 hypothetical protein [Algoriphagus sp.]HAS58899.1 hypothetical protein [Algoriphagus sp.]HAZ26056.1 hypothetical protein [Algoriphagus sp.]|tara:strand:+ start:867 stop:1079 length:213 start_codon:yes stop_codon:yes gene_type:complete
MKIFGIILIIAGVFMLFSGSISFTTKEKVIDAGPLEVTADKENKLAWPQYAGGIVVAAGIVILVVSSKKK